MNGNRGATFYLLLFSLLFLCPRGATSAIQSIISKAGTVETGQDDSEAETKEDLGPRGSIVGRVVDWQGNPIPGAKVHIQKRPYVIYGMLLRESMPDLDLEDGEDPVETEDVKSLFETEDEKDRVETKDVEDTSETDDEEKPVKTDLDGVFKIVDIKPGHYTLIVEAIGFPLLAQPGVPVIENRQMEVRLVLRPIGSLAAKRVKIIDERPPEKKREECKDNPEKCK